MVQWLQPTPLNTSSYRDCGRIDRAVDGTRQCGIRLVHDNARESTEDHFDLTLLIATAFWAVGVGKTDRDPLDRCAEFAELHSELSADVVAVLVIDGSADPANVRGR
jgi:hypothetical protein